MASPSDSRDTTSDETEVTSKQQNPDFHHHHHHNYNGEVRSAAAMGEQLAGQSSIYSLTLDEIQNTVCGPGKPFGSMNMDEFLANIWSAEEANAAAPDSSAAAAVPPPPPLLRQASLTLPPPLSGKTVDEVWAEIHRDRSHHLHQQQQQQPFLPQQQQARRAAAEAAEPPNFGEMTLEDFLIKAGVVKEDYAAATQAPATPAPYGYQIGAAPEAAGYGAHVIGVGYGGGERAPPAAVNGYGIANGKSDAAAAVYGGGNICFGGGGARIGNGYGSPTSPVSEDGQVDNAAGPYGGGGGGGGRKRGAEEATVEKVVERRQRRMIKNRESAARSRARKQAYTVELEAELNQLKEENARLKAEEKRILALWKQMMLQTMSDRARANAAKTVRKLRRCNSMPM